MSHPTSYTLRTSVDADLDLEDIYLYGLKTWGEKQADKYQNDLNMGLLKIVDDPSIGRITPDIPHRFLRYNINEHSVFYRLEENTVFVVRVLYSRMDLPRHLQ